MMSKRRKPWYRARNIVLAVLLGGLVWLGWAVYFALTAKPGDAIDYAAKLNELARVNQPGDPDAPNRWGEYEALIADCQNILDEWALGLTEPSSIPWHPRFIYDTKRLDTEEDVQIAQRYGRECLSYLRENGFFDRANSFALTEPVRIIWIPNEDEIPAFASPRSNPRVLANVNLAEFHVAVEEAREIDALNAVRRNLSLGQSHASAGDMFLRYFVDDFIAKTCESIQSMLSKGMFTTEFKRQLIRSLTDVHIESPRVSIELEKMKMIDVVNRVFSDDGDGNGRLMLNEARSMGLGDSGRENSSKDANLPGLVLPDKHETIGNIEFVFDIAMRATAAHPSEQHQIFDQYENAVEQHFASEQLPLQMLLPAIPRVVYMHSVEQAILDATIVLLAIDVYRDINGAIPLDLDELVPSILLELPRDVYSSDGQIRYLRRDSTSDDPREFILYTVGSDGIDDGGRPGRGWLALLYDDPGTDHVFNPNPLAPDDDQ